MYGYQRRGGIFRRYLKALFFARRRDMFKQLKEEGFDVFMMSFCFSVIALLLQGFSINDDANKKNRQQWKNLGRKQGGMKN